MTDNKNASCRSPAEKVNEPSHIMCIGWPTIKRLAAGESVWFDDIQCGAIAADDLHGCDIEGMLRAGPCNSQPATPAEVAKLKADLEDAQIEIRNLQNAGGRSQPDSSEIERLRGQVEQVRVKTVDECIEAARTAFEGINQKIYVMEGPAGIGLRMLGAIRKVALPSTVLPSGGDQ